MRTRETLLGTHKFSFTVFPDALNYGGSLFGGKLLAEMDLAASNAARRLLYGTDFNGLVTAHISEVDFLHPANLGDIIDMDVQLVRSGSSSLTFEISATSESLSGERKNICSASFVMVALQDGKPFKHGVERTDLQS